jgi:hypothetical protein
MYEGDDPAEDGIYMIWPEFEDEQGHVLLDQERHVPSTGTARMWIASPKTRIIHCSRMKPGTKGYFMEGQRRVAEAEIIEIVGLHTNET